jgi:hypothetical protein
MRDPLFDPQPGDRVRALPGGYETVRYVTSRTEFDVGYIVECPLSQFQMPKIIQLASWRSWCSRNKAVEVKG